MVRVRPVPAVSFFCPQLRASIGLHCHLTPLLALRCDFCFLVVILAWMWRVWQNNLHIVLLM